MCHYFQIKYRVGILLDIDKFDKWYIEISKLILISETKLFYIFIFQYYVFYDRLCLGERFLVFKTPS